ncbi:MAG: hypothetical protein ACO22Y_00070 [Sediminibacterium sp.]
MKKVDFIKAFKEVLKEAHMIRPDGTIVTSPDKPTDKPGHLVTPDGDIKKEGGEDHEVSMAQNSLVSIIKAATELMAKLGDQERNIPGWIQDHITNAENYLGQAAQGFHELENPEAQPNPAQMALESTNTATHLTVEEKKKGADGKACWDGYKYMGTKNGKDICVKIK